MPEFCSEHSGVMANIKELCGFKKKLDGGEQGMGELDRMWQSIEKKVSKGVVIGFAIALMTLVTTLFGLVYNSNSKVLHEMVDIKVNIQLIMEKLK